MKKFINPLEQRINIIRYIGDKVTEKGRMIELNIGDIAQLNEIADETSLFYLMEELKERDEVKFLLSTLESWYYDVNLRYHDVNLSLEGWKIYEEEKRGMVAGNYGFIAMEFDNNELETFVQEVVKPTVKKMGHRLIDVRDVSQAGIIDNIIRSQIRSARFVIADLTHDNNGAYWEAGYAEGLGKPVIYICEKTKFEEKRTHFDTNHCTTVLWSRDDDDGFRKELTATLDLSLEEIDDQL